jgi:4-hydroxythreonine-4-phosphate dehydrogenase
MVNNKVFLGTTAGDPNGIGMELILKAFSNESLFDYCNPVLYATPHLFKFYKDKLELENVSYKIIKSTKDFEKGKINLKVITDKDFECNPGNPSIEAGQFALKSLQMAVADIKNGEIHNLLTCPIDKNTIKSEAFNFNGHTEYLAQSFDAEEYMMLLVNEDLRVGLVTGHIPINQIANNLSKEKILSKLKVLNDSLIEDFGIIKPKIAVLGLNPHSGDNGVIGKEEIEIINPAVKEANEAGIMVMGAYPADGFFGSGLEKKFDAVLAMYHDQGLIPFKQVAFFSGVNYTAGLPIVRTSPDHGTAYDIAGKGEANIESFVAAIFQNNRIYRNRIELMDLKSDPLPFTKHRREKFSIGIPNLK